MIFPLFASRCDNDDTGDDNDGKKNNSGCFFVQVWCASFFCI